MTVTDLTALAPLIPIVGMLIPIVGGLLAAKKIVWTDAVAEAAAQTLNHYVKDPALRHKLADLVKHAEEAIPSSPDGFLKYNYVDTQLEQLNPKLTPSEREHMIHGALTDLRAVMGHFYDFEEHELGGATPIVLPPSSGANPTVTAPLHVVDFTKLPSYTATVSIPTVSVSPPPDGSANNIVVVPTAATAIDSGAH